jgi:hypothetical protein
MENRSIPRNPLRRPDMGGKTDRVTFFEHLFYSNVSAIARRARLTVALGRPPASRAGGVRLVLGEAPLAEQVRVGNEGTDDLPVLGPMSGLLSAGLVLGEFHISKAYQCAACRCETWPSNHSRRCDGKSRRPHSDGRSAGPLRKKELTVYIWHGAAASNEW